MFAQAMTIGLILMHEHFFFRAICRYNDLLRSGPEHDGLLSVIPAFRRIEQTAILPFES